MSIVLIAPGEEKDPPAAGLVTPVPNATMPFKVLQTTMSPDGRSAVVHVRGETGIFRFQLSPIPPDFVKLTVVVEKERFCEGLSFQPVGGKELDLLSMEGTTVAARGADLAMDFSGNALKAIRAGGQVQFVNQYR